MLTTTTFANVPVGDYFAAWGTLYRKVRPDQAHRYSLDLVASGCQTAIPANTTVRILR